MSDTTNPIATPRTQRDAVRAEVSPADLAYIDRQVAEGLRSVSPATCSCCGAGSSYRLNIEVVPEWLCDAVGHDTPVHGSEAGYPQLCRVGAYVDWLAIAPSLGDRLRIDDEFWPTTVAAMWCETIRRPSTDYEIYAHNPRAGTYLDVAIWVEGVDRFRVEAWALVTSAPLPPAMHEHVEEELSAAQAQIKQRHGDAGDFFYDLESSSWQFC